MALILIAAVPVAAASQEATPGYVYTPSPAQTGTPQILKVELNTDRLRAGGPIAIRVTTTPDVVKVVSGNGKRQGTLTQLAPGVFGAESTLPSLGGPVALHIKIHFAATTADGKATAVDVPVTYH